MTLPLQQRIADHLANLAAAHRLRRLEPAGGIDFVSNDYLNMAAHPRLRESLAQALLEGLPAGAGAARLLRGNHPVIAECETHMAQWLAPAHAASPRAGMTGIKCLLTSSGYQANYLLLSSLPQHGDVILYDANIHASTRDGIRASHSRNFKFAHNDMADLKRLLETVVQGEDHKRGDTAFPESYEPSWDPGSRRAFGVLTRDDRQIFIVTESLFSMDGDFAPLAELLAISNTHNAMLIVDEAHATGIYGLSGKGCCENLPRDNLITVHTGGKALGAAGGMIAARSDIIDYLINTARAFIFSTAPMPTLALALTTATQILDDEPWRRERLMEICAYAHTKMQETGHKGSKEAPSCILPIIIGDDKKAVAVAEKLQAAGYDIRAVRPPAVPPGTARLRISLNITHTPEMLDGLLQHL